MKILIQIQKVVKIVIQKVILNQKIQKVIIKVFQKPILLQIQIEMKKNLKKRQIIMPKMNKKLIIIIMRVRGMVKKLKKKMNLKRIIIK
jgi:hypothetical protein